MEKDDRSIKCSYCDQVHHLEEFYRHRALHCSRCGKQISPLIFDNVCETDSSGFYVLLGFFAIASLLGALSGVMLMHGWNFWVVFFTAGGLLFLIGKVFIAKYKIVEVEEYFFGKVVNEESHIKGTTNFDQLVLDAIRELPQNIKTRLSNVSIVVEDRPNTYILEKLKLKSNRILLGVFQGIPLNKKSVWHSSTLPEKITLFQKNIESVCRSEEDIKQRIKKVVRHEVAHYVGFSEEEIRQLGY
ncbi:MAG: hypothetical protein E3K37_08335 [Candidatus Kuenenia sp.]|nr:hypothetical protein [Candidatus Kuenenia hertensis]